MSLDKFIRKFERDKYEIDKEQKISDGKQFTLKKKGGLLSQTKWIFGQHLTKSEITTGDLVDFMQIFHKFYDQHKRDKIASGFFLVTGKFEKSRLNYVMEREDKKIRDLVEIKVLESGKAEKQVYEGKEVEAEPGEWGRTPPALSDVVGKIKKWSPARKKTADENYYENGLSSYLSATYPNLQTEYAIGRTRIDIVIGSLGIELKRVKQWQTLRNLKSQVADYQKHFDHIICVLIAEGVKQTDIAQFKKEVGPKVTVITK